MKRFILLIIALVIISFNVSAQQIAVVNGSGNTSIYDSFDSAITSAPSGSTIYLPGGGFQHDPEVKITRRLTIMGISHKSTSENADGNTLIGGNICFAPGSDGSAIMGCYLTNDVQIGDGGRVSNILLKYNNINSIQVMTDSCPGIKVNQNYVRSASNFRGSNVYYSNNISHYIDGVHSGIVEYNTFIGYRSATYTYLQFCVNGSNYTSKYNIICEKLSGSLDDVGSINIDMGRWAKVYQGISTKSDLHFKDSSNLSIEVFSRLSFVVSINKII